MLSLHSLAHHTLSQLWNFLGPILDVWVQYVIKWVRDPFRIVHWPDWIHLDQVSAQNDHPGSIFVNFRFSGPCMCPVWALHGPTMGRPWPQSGPCMGQGWAQAWAGWGSLVQGHLTLYENKNSLGIFILVQGQIQNPWPWSLQEA